MKKDFGEEIKFPRVNYSELLKVLGESNLVIGYVNQQKRESKHFINYLQGLKIQTRVHTCKSLAFNATSWITLDILTSPLMEEVILCTSDRSVLPLVQHLTSKGTRVKIVGKGISNDLRRFATSYLELDASFLQRDI